MIVNNDFDLQNQLQYELIPGEKLLWTGKPKGGLVLRLSDGLLIPFSLFWAGFSLFWFKGALETGNAVFSLFGVPFLCVGLYITVGRFFYDKMLREKTIYGITQNRIIIKGGVFRTSVETLNIHTLSSVKISEKTDGSGTITFDENNYPFRGFVVKGWPGSEGKQAPALEFIPNVRSVYNLILQQQQVKVN